MLATIPKGANTQRCPSSAGVDASMSQVREGRLLPRMTDRLTSLVVRNERIKPDVMLKFYLDIIGTRTSSRSPKFMGLSSSKKTTLRRRPPPPSTSARWCLTVTSGRSFACSSRRSKYISLSFWLFRLALRVRVKGEPVERIIRNHLVPPDPALYRTHMCYRIHLFRRRDG